jgi:hypothetical protein
MRELRRIAKAHPEYHIDVGAVVTMLAAAIGKAA